MTRPAAPHHLFHTPSTTANDRRYLEEALQSGKLAMSGGFSRRCAEWLERTTGARRAILTTSCTDALEMMALLLDVGPGDEVIIPSFTFVSTANAFALRGAVCHFVDVSPGTMNLDPACVERAVTSRTRAIVAVHYGGVGAPMPALLEIGARYGIPVLEDAAQAIGASLDGRPLGSLGALAALSFHETKNLHCGEGGALLINDPRLIERAELLRDKGTDRARFLRGEVDKYTWRDLGSSFGLSDLNAALLLAQLEETDSINSHRRALWRRYDDVLRAEGLADRLGLATVPPGADHNAHLYFVRWRDAQECETMRRSLAAAGIQAVTHYVPLHTAPGGRRFGRTLGSLPVTERDAPRLLRLPMHQRLSVDEAESIARTVARLARGQPA